MAHAWCSEGSMQRRHFMAYACNGVMWLASVTFWCYGGTVVTGSPAKASGAGSDVVLTVVMQ